MTSEKKVPDGRDRPYPWICAECGAMEVYPLATDYTTSVKFDGRTYSVRIPDLEIPTCRKCGERTFAVGDDARIFAAVRSQADLLAPLEIQQRRNQLGLSRQDLARRVGVPEEALSRWERGGLVPSRQVDDLLRQVLGIRQDAVLRVGLDEPSPVPIQDKIA